MCHSGYPCFLLSERGIPSLRKIGTCKSLSWIKSLETLLENVRRLLRVYAGNICKRQIIFPPSQVLGSLSVVYIKDGLCLYIPDRALINHLVHCKRMEEKNGGYWKADM